MFQHQMLDFGPELDMKMGILAKRIMISLLKICYTFFFIKTISFHFFSSSSKPLTKNFSHQGKVFMSCIV